MSLTFSKIDYLVTENLKNSGENLSFNNSNAILPSTATLDSNYYKESWLKMKMSVLEKQDEILQLKARLLDHNSKIADENLKNKIIELQEELKLVTAEAEKWSQQFKISNTENTELKLALQKLDQIITQNNVHIKAQSNNLIGLKQSLENRNIQINTYELVFEAQTETISELEKKIAIKDTTITSLQMAISNFEEKFALLIESLDTQNVKSTTQEILKKLTHLMALQKSNDGEDEFKKIIRNWIID